MTVFGLVRAAIYVVIAAAGVVCFFVGAFGSLRVRRWRIDLTLTLKQRLFSTAMGLMILAIAWSFFSG